MNTLFWIALGCRPGVMAVEPGPGGDDDTTDVWFDDDRVLEVEVEVDPADWDVLRKEGRSFFDVLAGDCLAEPFADPFTWFPSTVTVDGVTVDEVGVRKKGFIGSLDDERPSLKLKFDKYVDGQLFDDQLERLTFNNGRQDPSRIGACVVYGLFEQAGLPAPRCSFAHVSVNGTDLGVYANVEAIKKAFLARAFGADDGSLYEGTLSDFREGWTGTFEAKTDDTSEGQEAILAVIEAIDSAPDELPDALAGVLDVDAFLRFMAMEALVLHWDGYASNRNNYFIYAHPETGLIHFIPWGADEVLNTDASEGWGASAFTTGALARAVYQHDTLRERYHDALRSLLDEVWDEEALHQELDRIEDQLGDHWLDPGPAGDRIDVMREVVEGRRDEILAEIEGGGISVEPYEDTVCMSEVGSVTWDFDTKYNTLAQDAFSTGDADLQVVWGDSPMSATTGAVAGESEGDILLFGVGWLSDTVAMGVYTGTSPELFAPGTVDIDLLETFAMLLYYDTTTMSDFEVIAYIAGDLTFETAEAELLGSVVGQIEGTLYGW